MGEGEVREAQQNGFLDMTDLKNPYFEVSVRLLDGAVVNEGFADECCSTCISLRTMLDAERWWPQAYSSDG